MNNLQEAAWLSILEWAETLPDPEEVEPYEFSEKFERNMKRLLDRMRNDRLHTFTRSAARAILIAAVIMAVATVALASTVGKDFIIEKFDTFSTYVVADSGDFEDTTSLTLNYVPEGFELQEETKLKVEIAQLYQNGDLWFDVSKEILSAVQTFNTEHSNADVIEIDGKRYIYHSDTNAYNGLMWNDSTYVYIVSGNISKDEMLLIAQNIK